VAASRNSPPPKGWQSSVCRGSVPLASFPLATTVAFAGSRHGSPYPVQPVVAAVLNSGGSVRVGCAAGVDSAVRLAAPGAVVLSASSVGFSHLPPVAALAARTVAVVSAATALCIFPPASGVLGPGSSLALSTAFRLSIPIWLAGPVSPQGANWSAHSIASVQGWLHYPQPTLF